jgi:hypothetical protein
MDLAALLAQVLLELEKSTDPERRALFRRLQEGTHTLQDASDVTDMIESVVERTRWSSPPRGSAVERRIWESPVMGSHQYQGPFFGDAHDQDRNRQNGHGHNEPNK